MTINIALADDHTIFRKSLIRLFRDCEDLRVTVDAADGKELLDALILCHEEVHVVILDLQMPEMDGMSCLSILRERYPELKVIILSQLTAETFVRKAMQAGAYGFYSKDTDPEALIRAVLQSRKKKTDFQTNLSIPANNAAHLNVSDPATFEFSKRELEVIYLSSIDLKNKEIADKLGISTRTVEGHKNNLMKKTGCHSFLAVVVIAMDLRLI